MPLNRLTVLTGAPYSMLALIACSDKFKENLDIERAAGKNPDHQRRPNGGRNRRQLGEVCRDAHRQRRQQQRHHARCDLGDLEPGGLERRADRPGVRTRRRLCERVRALWWAHEQSRAVHGHRPGVAHGGECANARSQPEWRARCDSGDV